MKASPGTGEGGRRNSAYAPTQCSTGEDLKETARLAQMAEQLGGLCPDVRRITRFVDGEAVDVDLIDYH